MVQDQQLELPGAAGGGGDGSKLTGITARPRDGHCQPCAGSWASGVKLTSAAHGCFRGEPKGLEVDNYTLPCLYGLLTHFSSSPS